MSIDVQHHLNNSASSVQPPNHFQPFRLYTLHSVYSRKETVILTCTLHVTVLAQSCASGMGLKPLDIKAMVYIFLLYTSQPHCWNCYKKGYWFQGQMFGCYGDRGSTDHESKSAKKWTCHYTHMRAKGIILISVLTVPLNCF